MRTATLLVLALLAGCQGCGTNYPATKAITCVRSSLPVVPPAVQTVQSCIDVHRGNEAALSACVASSIATALTALDAAMSCLPDGPQP